MGENTTQVGGSSAISKSNRQMISICYTELSQEEHFPLISQFVAWEPQRGLIMLMAHSDVQRKGQITVDLERTIGT